MPASLEPYPIGTPGQPWGDAEKRQWLDRQAVRRSYRAEVLDGIDALRPRFDVEAYGALPYDPERYPLFAVKSRGWRSDRPKVLITGGVHGYETSGVQGALRFLEVAAEGYAESFDFLVAPCLSPWGYETINRWNPRAVDPNRSFFEGSDAPEATLLMTYVRQIGFEPEVHFDLHETTDTDNSEFRPALAARDGRLPEVLGPIPDGFYTVAPAGHPEPAFQTAVIAAVEAVTAIAPPDDAGQIIGCPVQGKGIIHYDKAKLFLCGGFTAARFVTTTEVYPDSPHTDPEICIRAQVAAVRGGLDHRLALDPS